MTRGDIWFAATPGGDRPVLVLTHTLPRHAFRRRVAKLSRSRLAEACQTLRDSFDC